MKIGTSLGKCVKSILAGEVKEEDVLFIVTNTNCPTIETLMGVMEDYYYTYQSARNARERDYDMSDYSLTDVCSVAERLFKNGMLHQPRAVGSGMYGNAHALKDTWYDIVPSPTSDNESVQEAWNHYTMIKKLAS